MMYVWTKKAEEVAKEMGLEPRKAGDTAKCGKDPLSGQIAQTWLKNGYIKTA